MKELHDRAIVYIKKEYFMNISRRKFFASAVGFVTFGLFSSLAQAEQKRRGRPAAGGAASGPLANPLVDPKDPTAQAMNYVEKHANLKKADLKIERSGLAFDKQFCHNCSFYTEVGTKDGSKVGTCTIFAGKLVKADAWCASWNKKA